MKLIDADKLERELLSLFDDVYSLPDDASDYDRGVSAAYHALMAAEAVDAVRVGYWSERVTEYETGYKIERCACSVCGRVVSMKKRDAIQLYTYCPECGSKMVV